MSAGDGQVKKGWKKAKDRFTILFSEQAEERVRKLCLLFLVIEMKEILHLNPKKKKIKKETRGRE